MQPTLVILVVGLTPALVGAHTPNLQGLAGRGGMRPLRTVTPAVTCTAQSTLVTGLPPSGHGAVANGWYFRDLAEVWLGVSRTDWSPARRSGKPASGAPPSLDPNDPHHMASVMQVASRPLQYDYTMVSGDWRYDRIWQDQELTWAKAIHRVAAEGISPERAVDEGITRIKQMLAE